MVEGTFKRRWLMVPNGRSNAGVPLFDLLLEQGKTCRMMMAKKSLAKIWRHIITKGVHGDEVEKLPVSPPHYKMSLEEFEAHGHKVGFGKQAEREKEEGS